MAFPQSRDSMCWGIIGSFSFNEFWVAFLSLLVFLPSSVFRAPSESTCAGVVVVEVPSGLLILALLSRKCTQGLTI